MILFILRLTERVPITEGVAITLLHPFHLWLERRKVPKVCRQQLVRSAVNCHRLYNFVLFHFQLPDELQEVHVKRFLPTQLMKSARMSSMTHRPTPEQRTLQFGLYRSSLKMTRMLRLTEGAQRVGIVNVEGRRPFHLWQ